MKQTIFRTVSLLTFLLAGMFVTVQAQHVTRFTLDVPFDFTVNNQGLPTGKYQIYLREHGKITHLRIRHADTQKSVAIFAHSKEARTPTTTSKAIFRRYGNRYFLGEVWLKQEVSGHEIARSNAENRVRKQIRKDHLADNANSSGKTEIVVLAGL